MTATCHQLGLERDLEVVSVEIERLAELVRNADFAAPVPTCPPWTIRDLAEHIGSVHRWAANHVRMLSPARIPAKSMDFGVPAEPAAFPDWLLAGRDFLLETVRGTDPDAGMWAWGSDPHARFWHRRMLHETAVHRADADIALGLKVEMDEAEACDGVDEFLDNLPHAARWAPNVEKLRGAGETIALRGAPASWMISLEAGGFTWRHDAGPASATVEGEPAALLLFVYGRRKPGNDGVVASGDADVLARWIENSPI